ncbi:translation elongation factor Tu [Exophiala sideris]|uniref:Elongation factor 1 alpha-like protein n=1 Tax=Exophiala sideris TaxID=1016849 RepID=A0A0D1YK45_9EURO|nr:translation elongation factor Tu [Exophiala sideris]
MSNRRVKSLAFEDDGYDDDDYDDFDGGDDNLDNGGDSELSPEDKEQMRLGSIKVREALGPTIAVSEKEIEETLWHYYYDVGKSVDYLKNQHKNTPIPSKKQTNASKKSAATEACLSPFSAADFFKDSPWLRIPDHRKAEIIIEPLYPRLGLLGGASGGGKMSKLAALAAKRRQKESGRSDSSATDTTGSQDDYAASLNKLRISHTDRTGPGARQHTDSSDTSSVRLEPESRKPEPDAKSEQEIGVAADNTPDPSVAVDSNLRGRPSAFASIMTSHDQDRHLPSSHNLLPINHIAKSFDFAEPSPDDVVTKAQTKAPTPVKPKPKDTPKSKSTLANGVQDLSLQDVPKIKSKNIDVISEYKKIKRKNAANFVVIGHVDAGKSTLMGRLLFDLKAVDERTMEKYRKEAERIGKGSFAFAWVLDQGTEERARGVTIDIATNNFETEKTNFTILDAPGHRDFVPNMIAGASQADFAVLVIDASTGNFESGLKGQTKEHALLVRSIGVQRLIVAVNKMDVADWSQGRFDEIRQQMAGFLSSAGFQPKNISFVPCSGLQGGNILTRASDPKASWYSGPTLVEELDLSEPSTHALDKPLRMTISDVFRGGVQNPLSVSGRLESGNIQVGEQVIIMPSGEKAQIRSLEVDDEPQEWAVAGQNVVLNLTDVDPIHLKTGDVLCSAVSPVQNITEFTAKLLAFDHLTPMNIDVHKGRLHVPGRITQLVGVLDKSSGAVLKKKPKIVQPGAVIRVVVQLDQAVPLEAPSRVVLRANGETVAAGLIE